MILRTASRKYLPNYHFEIAQSTLKYKPYDYQQEAIDFCVQQKQSLLCLSCGAGKTFIALGAYAQLIAMQKICAPMLVIVKASLKIQWYKEVEKFSFFKPVLVQSKKNLCANEYSKLERWKQRGEPSEVLLQLEHALEEKFNQSFQGDIFITTYETLLDKAVLEKLATLNFGLIAVDEAQMIKNHKAQRSKALYQIANAPYKIALTATPIVKNYLDIFGIFSFLDSALFKNYSTFIKQYANLKVVKFGNRSSVQVTSFKNIPKLLQKVTPYIFLKTEEDIAAQLPEIAPTHILWCRLDHKVQQRHDEMLADLEVLKNMQQDLLEHPPADQEAFEMQVMSLEQQILAQRTFMQELVDMPELLNDSESNIAKKYALKGKFTNPKLECLLDKVSELVTLGEKVCIFSRFERIQSYLEAAILKICPNTGIAKVHGGLSAEERYHQIYERFRDDPQCQVLIASNALAEGVSMGWCRYLIEYDLAESYAIQKQRHGRVCRADSRYKRVFIYQVVAENSYDEMAQYTVNKKQSYHNELLNK